MAVHTKTATEYEEEIRNLKMRMSAVEKSKIELMLSTSNEIDRLREYIKFMTGSHPTANKTAFKLYDFPKPPRPYSHQIHLSTPHPISPSSLNSMGGVATSVGSVGSRFDLNYRMYSKSPSMVKSHSGSPPRPQVDEMGWTLDEADMNGIMGSALAPLHDDLEHLNQLNGLKLNDYEHRLADSKSDQRSITSSSYKKARISGQLGTGSALGFPSKRQRRGTDYGNALGLSAAINIGNSIMVDAEDMKAAMDLNADLIEEMEAALNQFCELQLFGVVECECAEPKQLQFIATMNTNDDILYECDHCNESHPTIFKCDLCRMSICSKCEKYIAEMQCLRSVMEPFKYAHDFQEAEPLEFERFHSFNLMARTDSVDLKPPDFAALAELRFDFVFFEI